MHKERKLKVIKEKTTIGDKKSKMQLSRFKITLLQKIKADVFIRYRVIKMDPPFNNI